MAEPGREMSVDRIAIFDEQYFCHHAKNIKISIIESFSSEQIQNKLQFLNSTV